MFKFTIGLAYVGLAIVAVTQVKAQTAGPSKPNPDSQYRLGPDSLPQEGVPRGEIRGPYSLPSQACPGTNVGSFVNLRGGHVYPEKVLSSEKKPIRVYLCDGRNDNRGLRNGKYDETRDWFYQNVRLMKALTRKGYDVNYSWGINAHGQKFGGAILPDMMRWLWRDAPVSTDPKDELERSFRRPTDKKQ